MIAGKATRAGTTAYRALHAQLPASHWRDASGLLLSSLGWGSYLGGTDAAACAAYEEACLLGLQSGINVLDTASNYREQCSERDAGRALARFVAAGGDRAGVLVTSKAGFLHGDASSPLGKEWFQGEYVGPGLVHPHEIRGNVHCMTPRYIKHELARSRENLGLETIDVYFVHNPETALASGVPEEQFWAELEDVFVVLEEACDAGHIQVYGLATWDGLRAPIGHASHLALVKAVHAAGQARMRVGGKASSHHLRAMELPVSLAMPEAAHHANQPWRFGEQTTLEICKEQEWLTLASAPLMQTKLEGRVPEAWRTALGTQSDLETAFQFARSVPGVTSALVGCGSPEHMQQNIAWARARGPDEASVRVMMGSGWGHD